MNVNRPTMVVPAQPEEIPALAELMARAFQHDPVSTWLFPDDLERRDRNWDFFHAFLELAIRVGRVTRTLDGAGVALWADYLDGMPETVPHQHFERAIASATGPARSRWQALDAVRRLHHTVEPHWWLMSIATHPERQRRGVASALLRERHARLLAERGDGTGAGVYLEASTPQAVHFYTRHDYRQRPAFAAAIPGAPTLYPMCWRP